MCVLALGGRQAQRSRHCQILTWLSSYTPSQMKFSLCGLIWLKSKGRLWGLFYKNINPTHKVPILITSLLPNISTVMNLGDTVIPNLAVRLQT